MINSYMKVPLELYLMIELVISKRWLLKVAIFATIIEIFKHAGGSI